MPLNTGFHPKLRRLARFMPRQLIGPRSTGLVRRALARLQSAADGVEVVGTHDLFHDEDLAYAERLRAAGVHCDVEVVSGAFHGFDLIVPSARVSKAFFASQCAAMAAAVG